jgi:hypothetical protein
VESIGGVVSEVDIDTEDHLIKEFAVRIPVLLGPDGQVLAEGVFEERPLRRQLRRLRRSGNG